MKSYEKAGLKIVIQVLFVSGLILSGCSHLKNKGPETLSPQEKDSATTIERQEANGDLTSTEAAMEKDSLKREHLIQF